MRYLITGVAGFIGSSITDSLLHDGHEVIGIDCFTDYYDVALKRRNLESARSHDSFELVELDLAREDIPRSALEVDGVFHQAAQAGVRASWGSEFATYTDCNVLATQRLLEQLVRHSDSRPRVVYASSSSVYGNAESRPTREDALPSPISPYGVTKLAAEHLHSTYFHNFGLPGAALRYFTVFGERQRPDMAFHRFCRAAVEGTKITIYGDGTQSRDFTYIADAVAANRAAMDSSIDWDVYNIGGGATITVREVLDLIADLAGTTLDVDFVGTQKGDVRHTSADTSRARAAIGYDPTVDVRTGLERELAWMRDTVTAGAFA
jgi:UDP-glucose 4-epimerase